MIILLSAASDEGWFGYVARGHFVSAHGRTREEARIELLKKLEKLGLPLPAPEAFEQPSASSLSKSSAEVRNRGAHEKFRRNEDG